MARRISSNDWLYAGDILLGLAQTLPPVLGATANLTYVLGKATADHENRLADLEDHEYRRQLLATQQPQKHSKQVRY